MATSTVAQHCIPADAYKINLRAGENELRAWILAPGDQLRRLHDFQVPNKLKTHTVAA